MLVRTSSRRVATLAAVAAAALLTLPSGPVGAAEPLTVQQAGAAPRSEAVAPPAQNFRLVGHNGLFGRGMNAAPAIYRHYLYVGSRTDGSRRHPHPGVQIVDIAHPRHPQVVGSIGAPNEGNVGETSR